MKKLSIIKKMTNAITVIGYCLLVIGMASCSDILETESELVEYEKDNTLDHPTDSVYSVMGIINKLQIIADRTVLLGETRADLMTVTDDASTDLKRLAAFDFSQANKYNQVSDYYAVINNCNYFLAHADTTMQRRGRLLFRNEYAAVKGFRAWTYLELAKIYGEVPLVTEPLMTEREAADAVAGPKMGIKAICDYFIDDLTPYANVDMPVYGNIGDRPSTKFFVPTRALLGDLCLWAGRYDEAAKWYSEYLNDKTAYVKVNSSNRVRWATPMVYTSPSGRYSVDGDMEQLAIIPMETRIFDGTISELDNIMTSTRENNYFFQLEPSWGIRQLSASQVNCIEYKTVVSTDTVYVPTTGMSDELLVGDLRLNSVYRISSRGSQDPYEEYSSVTQSINKLTEGEITTYRSPMVYLRFAEALNRAGYPQSAMLILKYGLCNENAQVYVDSLEYLDSKKYIAFDPTEFTRANTVGIHSRGSGDSQCNAYYDLPMPDTRLASRADTIAYQIPRVEDMIVTEMALEGAFEGYRFYDLMRVALRRSDPAYLADPVSRRNGTVDETLRALLMNTKNWYLPLP
jgi:hypothetical protein